MNEQNCMPLKITNIQRGCVSDGPGVRTTVFLKGCVLHCPWCCNPETISAIDEWFVDDSKCLFRQGISSQLCQSCVRKDGMRPLTDCPFEVARLVSLEFSEQELYYTLMRDKYQFNIEGGITFSGGEPLIQATQLLPILKRLKKEQIHIAFETTLVVSAESIEMVLPYVDLFIVDLKLQHEQILPSEYLGNVFNKLTYIREAGKDICYRLVIVPSILGYVDKVIESLHALNVHKIELLQCHNLGEKKYLMLNKPCSSYSCPIEIFNAISAHFEDAKLQVTKLCI